MLQNFILNNLGEVDLVFLEFLGLGNNIFLIWMMFIWFYFFITIGFFYSIMLISKFSFCDLIFTFGYMVILAYNLEFYEYFSMIFPFFGIFLSLSLNFSLLSLGASEISKASYFVIFVGKQWSWDFFCYYSMSQFYFLFFVIFMDFLNISFFSNLDLFFVVELGHFSFFSYSFLNSFFNLGSKLVQEVFFNFPFLVYQYDGYYSGSKDFNSEGCLSEAFFLKEVVGYFFITSLDVMHSFSITLLGVKVDGISGFFSGGVLEVPGKGFFWQSFEFGCFEYCGENHSSMFGSLFYLNKYYMLHFF